MLAHLRGWTRPHSRAGYEPLPTPLPLSIPTHKRRRTMSPRLACLLAPAAAPPLWRLAYVCLHPHTWRTRLLAAVYTPAPAPPLYARFRAAEAALPQHHAADPFAGGRRYLFASSHVFCACVVSRAFVGRKG